MHKSIPIIKKKTTFVNKKMYSIDYYNKEQFPQLKKDWERLQKGNDMTIYQSYAWYEMLNKVYVPEDTKLYISVYAVIKNDGIPVLIAPLWIILHTFKLVNKKGVYILGRSSWSDYLNFVYDEFNYDAINYLLNSITKKYKVKRFYLESLREDAQTFIFFRQNKKANELGVGTSVTFILPKTQDDYKAILSKNTRQNIRTAHNRQNKDGINIRVLFDDNSVDKDKCWNIREERFGKKFKRISPLRKIKYSIMRKLTFQFKSFLPFYTFPNGHFLTTYNGEDLCSFFFYIIDEDHKQILVLAAVVNSTYSKYSPGFVSLFDLINYQISIGDVDTIDFGVGDEKYKYSLGGQQQNINGIDLKV